MENQRSVNIQRTSRGMLDIGSNDEGDIVDMFFKGDYLYLVKDRAIYGVKFSDVKGQETANISSSIKLQKRILDMGAESSLVSRTYLTARKLFEKDRLFQFVDCEKALILSFDALMEISEMENEVHRFLEMERRADMRYESRQEMNLAYEIPTIPTASTNCKTIFQKADHTCQILMDICQLFYPELKLHSKAQFTSLFDALVEKYGDGDSFVNFFKSALPTIQLIRDLRNCLDHRLSEVMVSDYTIQVDGSLVKPGIEMKYKTRDMQKIELSSFLPDMVEKLVAVFEGFIFFLSQKSMEDKNFLVELRVIPLENRKNKYIQFGYWIGIGDGVYL